MIEKHRGALARLAAHDAGVLDTGLPTWNAEHGFYQWKCGCIQFQDGYELCAAHKPFGYTVLQHATKPL